jgi:hypothetical protein
MNRWVFAGFIRQISMPGPRGKVMKFPAHPSVALASLPLFLGKKEVKKGGKEWDGTDCCKSSLTSVFNRDTHIG